MSDDILTCPTCGGSDLYVTYRALVVQPFLKWERDGEYGAIHITDYDCAEIDFDSGLREEQIECRSCLAPAYRKDGWSTDVFLPVCPDVKCKTGGCPEHPYHKGDHTYEQHHDVTEHFGPGPCHCSVVKGVAEMT